jgi:glycosyltransferase involved in cell wall biosynthesis
MQRLEVSVIVPSYNKPEYLPECLKSIQKQTFRDWECIVVSDGSPRVEEIRAAVAGMHDERFRLVELCENQGLASARNTGVRESRADLVICVDEDDRIMPNCIAKLKARLQSTGSDLVIGGAAYCGGSTKICPARIPTLAEILTSQPLLSSGFLMRKHLWHRLCGWDENPVLRLGREDHDWWIRVIALAPQIDTIPDICYIYTVPDSETQAQTSLNHRARADEVRIRRYIVEKHRALYELYPNSKKAYLREGQLIEAAILRKRNARIATLGRLWKAAFISRQRKDVRYAARETLYTCASTRVIQNILALCHPFLAPKRTIEQGHSKANS